MDLMNRGARPSQPSVQPVGQPAHSNNSQSNRGKNKGKLFKVGTVALLFSAAILLVALAASMYFGKPASESKYINKDQLQAVFLNGGQVYFGRIKTLNDNIMRVSDIYYLQVSQQVQPGEEGQQNNNVSLVKLGCELHGPVDEMVINRDHIIFWENLKDEGQVAQAVAEYVKQNPNGQQCNTNTGNNNTNTNTNTGTNNNAGGITETENNTEETN